jgi:hypothetical protein
MPARLSVVVTDDSVEMTSSYRTEKTPSTALMMMMAVNPATIRFPTV